MIDLVNKLSNKDKQIIQNYIDYNGVRIEHFVGVDQWLQNWSHANQKLYKLLGNQFIYKIPVKYEKNYTELESQIRHELFKMPFRNIYHDFFCDYIAPSLNREYIADYENREGFSCITDIDCFIDNKIRKPIKIKFKNHKKTLQIQKDTKPMRALSKIIDYFSDYFDEKAKQEFEAFRLKHSMILNDKVVKGTLSISIHPMDFMTMSDNNANWSSCMSWHKDGCYRVGTVEMMNSNNVLCCYIEKSDPYHFVSKEDDETYFWNNKRWRCLGYVNKDIIMCGKAYPYINDTLSKVLITAIRDLAQKNLNWNYSFGPEPYQDMQYIYSNNAMEKNRSWYYYDSKKFNIIWDTKGMYNDMLNDQNTTYWCFRNKVKHKKIYSVSGKANCLCCNNNILINNEHDYEENEYNERYKNTSSLMCPDCESQFKCDYCDETSARRTDPDIFTFDIYNSDKKIKLCSYCFYEKVRICPCCNQPFLIKSNISAYWGTTKVQLKERLEVFYQTINWKKQQDINKDNNHYFEPIYLCEDCSTEKNLNNIAVKKVFYAPWGSSLQEYLILKDTSYDNPYRYCNLQTIEPDQCKTIKT